MCMDVLNENPFGCPCPARLYHITTMEERWAPHRAAVRVRTGLNSIESQRTKFRMMREQWIGQYMTRHRFALRQAT